MDRPFHRELAIRTVRAGLLAALTRQHAAWSRLQQTRSHVASDHALRVARRSAEADFDAASDLVEQLLAVAADERPVPTRTDSAPPEAATGPAGR